MPIPLAQVNPQADTQDTSSFAPQSSVENTYVNRAALTLEQGGSGSLYRDVQGAIYQRDGSEMLNKDDAEKQYGTTFDGDVSRDYAAFKYQQDTEQRALQDQISRGGSSSAQNTWLGFGLSQATGMLDVPGDAAAIVTDGITKFTPVARVLGDLTKGTDIAGARPATNAFIGGIPSRLASGAVKATAFNLINEPLQYALSDDKQNMSLEQAAESMGSGALFLALTEGLFGRTPLRFYSEDKDIPTPETQEVYKQLEDHLAPETQAAMSQGAVARSMQGKSFDPLNDLVGLDPRIMQHEAATGQTLSFEDRADLLKSMDDGTYEPPKTSQEPETDSSSESKVTLYRGEGLNPREGEDPEHTGRWYTNNKDLAVEAAQVRAAGEGGSKVYSLDVPQSVYEAGQKEAAGYGEDGWEGESLVPKELLGNRKAIMESYTDWNEDKTQGTSKMRDIQSKVTLPERGDKGFLELQPLVAFLTRLRVGRLQNMLLDENTEKPPQSTNPAPNPDLTQEQSNVTTLLQPYEAHPQIANQLEEKPDEPTEPPSHSFTEPDTGTTQGQPSGSEGTKEITGREVKEGSAEKAHKVALNSLSPEAHEFLSWYLDNSHKELSSLSLEELQHLKGLQSSPYPIKGQGVADLLSKGPSNYIAALNGIGEKGAKFLQEHGGANEIDTDDLENLNTDLPIIDPTGVANNHFDFTGEDKQLVSQEAKGILNKLDEGLKNSKMPETKPLVDIVPSDKMDEDGVRRLDAHFGNNNWILKPWHLDAMQGRGIYYPEQIKAALKGEGAFYNRGYASDDKAGFPLTREIVEKDIYPPAYMAQKRIWVKGETPELRREGNSIINDEKRVHLWTDNKGEAHVIKGGTVTKTAADRRGEVHLYDTKDVLDAERSAKEGVEGFPEESRKNVTFAADVIKDREGNWHMIESNPTAFPENVDERTGKIFDSSDTSGYGNIPAVELAHISALKGELPLHSKMGRDMIDNLIKEKEGQEVTAQEHSQVINKEEDAKQAGYNTAIGCVTGR